MEIDVNGTGLEDALNNGPYNWEETSVILLVEILKTLRRQNYILQDINLRGILPNDH